MFLKKGNVFVILLVLEAIIILALLPGCFREEELVDTFFGEDIMESLTQEDGHREFSGNRLVLSPGVYQIRAWTRLADGESMYVEMDYDNAYYKSLRNNGMVFFPGSDYGDFNVYVLDKVPSAYVKCSFYDVAPDALVQLEIWKTNMGNKMLLIILAAFFAMLDFLVIFRKKILEGKVTGKQQIVFWTLVCGVLLSYFPYMTDYFFGGDDSSFHLSRIAFLADALKQNAALPVRIESSWMYGHGYASSIFYGDIFLLFPALLCMAGFSIMFAYKIFVLLVSAVTAVVSYHSFYKCVKDEYGALFGSMIYLLSPYRIYDVYNRFAVGEYLALAFLPLVCCGMYLLYMEDVQSKEYKKYKWYVILGMSSLLQCHLLSTEMTVFLMALYVLVCWKKTFQKQTFCQLLESVGIVLLINAWFWLPLLYMLNCDEYHLTQFVESDMQLSGLLFGNFFYWLPYSSYKYDARNDVWIGAGMGMLLLFYAFWRYWKKEKDAVCGGLALFILLGLVMSTTYFPWNTIMKFPVIGYFAASLELPWRWLSSATLFLALLAANLFRQVKKKGGMHAKAALGGIAVVIVASAVYHVEGRIIEAEPTYLYNVENMGTIHVGGNGEYLLNETQVLEVHYHKPIAEEGLIWSGYEKVGTNVTIMLDNTLNEARHIEIPLTGYKGYSVKALESGTEIPSISKERGDHGDLRLEVPGGYRGTIRIFYEGVALFHLAEAISLISSAALFVIWLWKHWCPNTPLRI